MVIVTCWISVYIFKNTDFGETLCPIVPYFALFCPNDLVSDYMPVVSNYCIACADLLPCLNVTGEKGVYTNNQADRVRP